MSARLSLDTMGTNRKGKARGPRLLDGNPLAAIDNVRKIAAVVVDGRLLDGKALDGLLAKVESTNRTAH